MNYLAHLLLSGDDREIRFGNFIGDAIKGKGYLDFPIQIQKGILLHRKIDTYTDHHPTIKNSKKLLNPIFSHYKGVIIDVFFDHFLSKNWHLYQEMDLDKFLQNFENDFQQFKGYLTEEKAVFYQKFLDKTFLYHYHSFEGIELTLKGLQNRIKNRVPLTEALSDLQIHYDALETDFYSFFRDIQSFCTFELHQLDSHTKNDNI